MMLSLDAPRGTRKPDLTPMIDVVFLLLVFFMLASRLSNDAALPLANGAAASDTAPVELRLVELRPEGVLLNGLPVALPDLPAALQARETPPEAPVVLRGRDVTMQDLVAVMERLRAAGFTRLMLVE